MIKKMKNISLIPSGVFKILLLLISSLISSITLSNSLNYYNKYNFVIISRNEKKLEKDVKEVEEIKEVKYLKIKDKNLDRKVKLLIAAKKLLGKKYVWGASITDKEKFDCSSFVKALYREIGVPLPRVSRQQAEIGKKKSLNDLNTGDLIFFHTLGNYVSHVGMYIGNNKFVHASSKAGKIVVSDFTGFYREKAVFGTEII